MTFSSFAVKLIIYSRFTLLVFASVLLACSSDTEPGNAAMTTSADATVPTASLQASELAGQSSRALLDENKDRDLRRAKDFALRTLSPGGGAAESIVWGERGWLMAVGKDLFAHSEDGISFSYFPRPAGRIRSSIIWNGSAFVTVTASGILRSFDGMEWSLQELPLSTDHDSILAWGALLLRAERATDGYEVFQSSDGVHWHPHSLIPTRCGNVYFAEHYLVCVEEYRGRVLTSDDQGRTWILRYTEGSRLSGRFASHGDSLSLYVHHLFRLTTSDGVNWTKQALVTDLGGQDVEDMVPGKLVAAGADFYRLFSSRTAPNVGGVLHSYDGVYWTVEETGYVGRLKDMAVDYRGMVIAVGADIIVKEPTGSWVLRAPLQAELGKPSWNRDRILIPEHSPGGMNFLLETRDQGLSWQRYRVPFAAREVAWSGRNYVGVTDRGGIHYSFDGLDWYVAAGTETRRFTAVAWVNDRFIAVGLEGALATSINGAQWSVQSLGALDLDRIFFNGVSVIIESDAKPVLYSQDFSQWSPITGVDESLAGWDGEAFIALGSRKYRSLDGQAWQAVADGTVGKLKYAVWAEDRFFGWFEDRQIRQSFDGFSWRNPIAISHLDQQDVVLTWTGTHLMVSVPGASTIFVVQ